jgi:hypothetical protein
MTFIASFAFVGREKAEDATENKSESTSEGEL